MKTTAIVCFLLLAWGVWMLWFHEPSREGEMGRSQRRKSALMPPPAAGDPSTVRRSPAPPSKSGNVEDPFLPERTAWKTACAVASAIDGFHRDYDRLPNFMSAKKDVDSASDTSQEEGLIFILLGQDQKDNPRRSNYLGDLSNATQDSVGRKMGGLVQDTESAGLYDPWGMPYAVILDRDSNGRIDNPNENEAKQGNPEIHKTILVWSAGPDLKFETWEDNLASWVSPEIPEPPQEP